MGVRQRIQLGKTKCTNFNNKGLKAGGINSKGGCA
jgi:hypothetical protein